ncbi:TetR/AcrR family transcriptional regulator [Breoghania sp.]|uniref:TetR/AcrR family transcriptional regulator n=1 Tax=Breoghania sp. TaxID=2065378 RepID=UPI00260B9D6E|nr:TetR/AcrR family transcriptional regulator [Breoghania sp.]MDJ0932062.1 TetR/AcrR family transcriptional regulator [Breoghania sp.]
MVDQILAKSGVSRGTFYRYFDGRDGLAIEVLEERAERFERCLEERLEVSGGLRDGIVAVFEFLENWADEHGARGCLFQTSMVEFAGWEELHTVSRQHKTRVSAVFADFLKRHGHPDPVFGAFSMMLLVEGAVALATYGSAREVFRHSARSALVSFRASA